MRGRVTIVISIALLLMVLVGLNAASYVRVEQESDSEFMPDRSTFNAGSTGTRALYDFLQESGYKVVRWRKSPVALLGKEPVAPSTFVVIGELRREFSREESQSLLRWVAEGGRLVVIDRSPESALLPTSGRWRVSSEITEVPGFDIRPDNEEAMTAGVKPLAPTQPTMLTRDVEQILPSRFASRLHVYPREDGAKTTGGDAASADAEQTPGGAGDEHEATREREVSASEDVWPWATPSPTPIVTDSSEVSEESPAPVEHVADGREGSGALLVDFKYSRGRIVVLSDPYIVSNRGLSRADNLQLALNVVGAGVGFIAFDEYHQGRGASENMTLAYFRGTPVLAMLAQFAVIILAVLWTRSRRFARPLPAPHTDRRSNLEFVASMAELQQRARAYDLAIENLYSRTRRALARYGGTTSDANYKEIAARVASRSGREARPLEELMRQCEDAVAGEPLPAQKAVRLAAALRETERALGIRMRAREIRQAREL
ncbi:MAG TPA: DUF4350 domain-containing protein [Pyrinomonadaceae bacterium]|jgi:hypothetical protein